jgi:hypothetical protein
LYALNPDGTQKWNCYTGGYVVSSPAIGSDGSIYFGSYDNNLYALTSTRKLNWKYTTGGLVQSSPAIGSDGSIYFGSEDHKFYALTSTGKLKWTYTTGDIVGSSPAIGSDGTIYFGGEDGTLYAIGLSASASPTASATPKGGLYNTTKIVTLKMNRAGNIYYTKNGTTPTTISTKYTTPLSITTTTVLKFIAKDLAGLYSPVYTQKYTIDKIAPKVSTTTPTNLKTGVSRTSTIVIKFSENIKSGTYFNNIILKNLTTGQTVTTTKTITGNILNINHTTLSANTWYQVIIPAAAIKDIAGNNLATTYTFKFETGNGTVDVTPPKLLSVSILSNTELKITYSEPIKLGSSYAYITLKNSSGTAIPITKSISGNVLLIYRNSGIFTSSVTDILTLPSNSVKDLAGNSLTTAWTVTIN